MAPITMSAWAATEEVEAQLPGRAAPTRAGLSHRLPDCLTHGMEAARKAMMPAVCALKLVAVGRSEEKAHEAPQDEEEEEDASAATCRSRSVDGAAAGRRRRHSKAMATERSGSNSPSTIPECPGLQTYHICGHLYTRRSVGTKLKRTVQTSLPPVNRSKCRRTAPEPWAAGADAGCGLRGTKSAPQAAGEEGLFQAAQAMDRQAERLEAFLESRRVPGAEPDVVTQHYEAVLHDLRKAAKEEWRRAKQEAFSQKLAEVEGRRAGSKTPSR